MKKHLRIFMPNSAYTKYFIIYVSLQECPSGLVNEETFKDIYAQFFPQGGKSSYGK